MNRLDMETTDIVQGNIDKICELFPNVIVESENGKTIDFDLLKQELSNDIVEGNKEKYQLTWPGKKETILNANSKINKTLRPLKEKSVEFENAKNIYIEGDNLETLKILQESYLNKIDCIYIDPPYNTGNDFIYNDDYKLSVEEDLEKSGIIDEYGNRLITNNKSNSRYHSAWLSMIYSRLKLSRNLLKNDGLIFLSIDDNELYNLKMICDEIFGENNFIANIVVETANGVFGTRASQTKRTMVKVKDYVLIYSRDKNSIKRDFVPLYMPTNDLFDSHYSIMLDDNLNRNSLVNFLNDNKKFSKYFEKYGLSIKIDNISKLMKIDKEFNNDIISIADKIYQDVSYSLKVPTEIDARLKNGETVNFNDCIIFRTGNGKGTVRQYISFKDSLKYTDDYVSEYRKAVTMGDLWEGFDADMKNVTKEGNCEFPNGKKPVRLIKQLIKWANVRNGIILDFFSGSATTAQAVSELNNEMKLNNKWILVQVPEISNDAEKVSICNIGQQRIKNILNKGDGFRIYKVDSSNMKDIYYKPNEVSQTNLFDMISNIKDNRTSEDLLTQVILDLGLTLDLKILNKSINNNNVYFVEDNSLIACFDDNIDINIIDEICKYTPMRVVFKDTSFKTDKDKINLEEKMKKLSPTTEINII